MLLSANYKRQSSQKQRENNPEALVTCSQCAEFISHSYVEFEKTDLTGQTETLATCL